MKGIVQPKTKITFLFTYLHVIPNQFQLRKKINTFPHTNLSQLNLQLDHQLLELMGSFPNVV